MIRSFKALCDTKHVDRLENTVILQAWCREHVSTDIDYDGTLAEQHADYLTLSAHFLDDFLAHIPQTNSDDSPVFDGLTAIQFASQKGYDRYLTNHPCNVAASFNRATLTGLTPLSMAAGMGHLNTVRALLNHGADASKPNQNNQTPMFSALLIPMNHDEAFMRKKELIFQALNVAAPGLLTHQDNSGETVFHLMAAYGFNALLTTEIAHVPQAAFIRNNYTQYPIHTAILNNRYEIARVLLNIPTVATLTDANHRAPLHYAAQYGTQDMVELCCSTSHNINSLDTANKTPLMLAVQYQNIAILPVLIKHGADIHLTDYRGFTLLHLAIDTLNSTLIAWILDNTAVIIKQTNNAGYTALEHLHEQHHHAFEFSAIEHMLMKPAPQTRP